MLRRPASTPQPDPAASGVGRWLARAQRWTPNAHPVAAAVGVVAGASARSRRGATAPTKRFRCRSARQTLEPRDLAICLLREPGGMPRRRSPAACACDRRAHVVPAGAGANWLQAAMLFNSYPFLLAFLPGAAALFAIINRYPRLRIPCLLVFSLLFYGYWNPRFVLLLVGSILVNWLAARQFAATQQQRGHHRRRSC